jgi:plasmid segregation protein ParM
MIIAGIDAGNYAVKVASPYGLDTFPSAIGEYRERNLVNTHGDDIVFEYGGRKGFAGTLAELESEFGGAIMGDSKAHDDAKLRVLIALHRIATSDSESFKIVVGQPISKHTPAEKNAIRGMLIGRHEIAVNDQRKLIEIADVKVSAEGGAAFWSVPREGIVRIVDVGSATVNCASLRNYRFVDRESFTLPFGMNTVRTHDFGELARGIATHTSKKWHPQDFVLLVGGVARELTPYLRKYYPQATPHENPRFANALGFQAIARAVYG